MRGLTEAGDGARFVEALKRALLLHRSQLHALAAPAYRGVLALEPAHADALHLYGLARLETGAADAACRLIRRATQLKPGAADYHANLAHAARLDGNHAVAVAAFLRALALEPERADWRCGLGASLLTLGERPRAGRELRLALALDPQAALALFHLSELADPSSSGVLLARAAAARADFVAAHYNLANRWAELGQTGAAAAGYRRALGLDPRLVQAFNNLGQACKLAGNLPDAIRFYWRAVSLAPLEATFWLNLGGGLQADSKLQGGSSAYRRALVLAPHFAQALSNAGIAAQELGQLDAAAVLLRRALAVQANDAVVWNNLGNALTEIGCVVAAYRRAVELDASYREAHSNLLFALNYLPGMDCETLFGEYLGWAERHARPAYGRMRPHDNTREPERPLRIGYLSADFRSNPIAYNLIGLVERRNRTLYQAYCYAQVPRPDAMTERWRQAADGFRFIVGKSDEAVADLIRGDRIDILVCLGGHTANNRVLVCARKPAPVQMSYGDLSTTGLETMDYWLTDANVHPPGARERFTERLLHVPVLVIHEPPTQAPQIGPLPALASGRITFASFNNLAKLNNRVLALWSAVLKAVPDSQLLLKYVNWLDNSAVQERIAGGFAEHGISRGRLLFAAGRLPRGRHLELLNRVDVALDPFPFNGCTTTFEALWMGVPVVTLAGERWLGRMGVATLEPIGLGHLAAADWDGYVACAAGLCSDLPALARLRSELRQRVAGSPLCDAAAYARSVERAYRAAWRQWTG